METYLINNVEFKLRDVNDYTLEEDEKAREFMKRFTFVDNKTVVSGNITNEELTELFAIILVPVKGKLPTDFNFSKTKVETTLKIIPDFFLLMIIAAMKSLGILID